jgi:hypothetical protein
MQPINFSKIAPRCGSPNDAFEELCCQLARRLASADSKFDRFRGSGGDGGVECMERTNDGRLIGWQAKFVFDVGKLINQASDSLLTALKIHPDLTDYILCYPFDPTGPTGRKTKKGRRASCDLDKLDMWVVERSNEARIHGRKLSITLYSSSHIEALLLEHDARGGMREYFFNAIILSPEWFRKHIDLAAKSSEPRYSPKLKLDTPLHEWFEAFGTDESWREDLICALKHVEDALPSFHREAQALTTSVVIPPEVIKTKELCQTCLSKGKEALLTPTEQERSELISIIDAALDVQRRLGSLFTLPMEGEPSGHRWRSPLLSPLASLSEWLASPSGRLGFCRTLVLTGEGGSGKTHGICDMALKRLDLRAYSCVVFGHQFDGQATEWARLAEALGLPSSLGRDTLLDALDAAAEASGRTLIIWVDAINETEPRGYWRKRLKGFAEHVTARSGLRLCVSCRSSFAPSCLPDEHGYPEFEHQGFAGMERLACRAFFEHYGLVPPLAPILQPELSNPLYLKLVCETLKDRGVKHLPPAWQGVVPVIRAFLEEKEKRFAEDHDSIPEGAGTVSKSLHAIASKMASNHRSRVSFSEAQDAIGDFCPHAAHLGVIKWLIRADLLIEEGRSDYAAGSFETDVRLAFERLSDFLIASGMMPGGDCHDPKLAISESHQLSQLFIDKRSVQRNAGWVAAFSLLVAERWGIELPFLIEDRHVREATLQIVMRALAWRSPTDYDSSTEKMALVALCGGSQAMKDSLLRVATQPSKIDAKWLHRVISAQPIWERDPAWCGYLQHSFESNGAVASLIEAADNPDAAQMDGEVMARWALLLCWFTTAADRRAKDGATRALTRVFCAHPQAITEVLANVQNANDDDLIERALLAAYGSLLITRSASVTGVLADSLLQRYQTSPESFQNAQIRDLIRCVAELAKNLGCLSVDIAPGLPTRRQKTGWSPELPSKTDMDRWCDWQGDDGALYKAAHSCTDDDFNHYTIGCLGPWMDKMGKIEIGQWLTKHLVDDFHIDSKAFDEYDKYVSNYGYGRGKPTWAERIGKKYQWIALNRLASRLHDKYPRKADGWKRKLVRQPLILQEERKLDPTIPTPVLPESDRANCWWSPVQVSLADTKHLSFADWTKLRDDLPSMEAMLTPVARSGQYWRSLHTMQSWSEYREREADDAPYRDTWFHLRSYLVPCHQFDQVMEGIGERNYFQGWLPEGGSWLHCFLGEYPWATSFNTEPDSYMGAGTALRDTDLTLIHTSNTINCEWQYDGTLDRSIQFLVPTKQFFKGRNLRWDSRDGFMDQSGKTIFRDPHGTEGGKAALMVDVDVLPHLLKKLGYRLVWTLLGGKNILAERYPDHTATEVYSQFASLSESGDVIVGRRRFYADHQDQIGPDPAFISHRPRPTVEFTVNSIRFNG